MTQQRLTMLGGALLGATGYYAYANNMTVIRKPFHQVSTLSGYPAYETTRSMLMKQNEGPFLEYFISGNKENGKLWCPDCEAASSIVQKAVKNSLPKGSRFLEVTVGAKNYWKDQNNEFRTQAGVKCIPMLRWAGSPDKFLNDDDCQNYGKVLAFISRQD